MSIISTFAGTAVQVFGESGKAICSIAGAIATMATAANDGAGALGQLASAAKGSATEYNSRVMETINPTDPADKARVELNKKLRIIAHRDYKHLPFLNEDNAAPVLKGVIGVLQEITKQQGKELHPMDWYLCYLADNNCNRKLIRIIAGAYQEYLSILAEAGSAGKGSKSDTSGSGINLVQGDPEMDELLAQQQAYQNQSYGQSSDGYVSQPQPQEAASVLGSDVYGVKSAPQNAAEEPAASDSSASLSELINSLDSISDSGSKTGSTKSKKTGSAGSKSSSKKNQQ